jgi:hypothetical protein
VEVPEVLVEVAAPKVKQETMVEAQVYIREVHT